MWIIFFSHFIGDFVLQSDRMAINKCKDWSVLLEHTAIVGGCIFFGSIFATQKDVLELTLLMCIHNALHFGIDAVTSQITKYFYLKEDRHNFFVTIGFDQFLHTIILYYLYA